jgi:hypothetical protein
MITGNPNNDLKGPNDNLVSPEENLFHSCGLSSASDGVTFTDNCDAVYAEELCPGEHQTHTSWAGMIYKRDEISDFLEDVFVANSLVKRQDSLVNETNFPNLEEATLICTNLSDHHIALNETIQLGNNTNEWWVQMMNETESLIAGCAGIEGAPSLYTIQLTFLVITTTLDTLVLITRAALVRLWGTGAMGSTNGRGRTNQTSLDQTSLDQMTSAGGAITGEQV